MDSDFNPTHLISGTNNTIKFEDVFNLNDIQHIQDLFSTASGVASMITQPDGTPITRPSNFCRLCNDIIRKSEKGLFHCFQSDAMIGRYNPSGPILWPCLSAGLWEAGASITVGGVHIANWLIGQVRNDAMDEQKMLNYADEIGVDREEFLQALYEVPVMSLEQFDKLAKMLFAFAKEISDKGYNNLLLKQQVLERDNAIKLLKESEKKLNTIYESVQEVFCQTDLEGIILEMSPSIKYFTEYNREELIGTSVTNLYSSPSDRENLLNTLIKYGELKDSELKIKTKSGEIKHISINAHFIFNNEGKPTHIAGAIRDITNRKQTEEALRENEIKYRELVNNSPDAVAIHSEGKVVFVNNECMKLLAVSSADELVGKPVMNFVHPDYRNIVIERMKNAVTIGTVLPLIEEKFIRVDGVIIDVEVKAMSIMLENKLAVQLIFRDISERKKAEEERAKLEKAIYTSGEVVFMTDCEGIFTFVNPAFTTLYGYSADEIIGRATPRIIKSGLYDNSVYDNFWLTLLKGEEVKGELINKKKDGSLINIDGSATPILDEDKKIIGFLGIQRDITQRKLAEQLLIESEESYRSLFDNMLNGFAYCQMLYENDIPSDLIYLKVNKTFESLTGLKDVEGKNISAIVPGIRETDQKLFEIYGRVAITGKPEFFEMYVRSLFDWYSISVYSPKKGFIIAVFDVITERKKALNELIIAKEKAEESDRLKTAFLNNISHEIRTPFNGILGFLSLIQDNELSPVDRDQYIGIVNQSAERLMNTINEIVEISQIQAGQTKLTLTETNLNKLIGELINKFKHDVEFQGLECIINNKLTKKNENITTDSAKLLTILSNLISNALKFTKQGSIELGICNKENYLEFLVRDTGIGIPENQQQIIFERFIQADISRSRQYEGLGLGLSIARYYVEMLGGKIWLESEVGQGSTFHFTLPFID